MSALFPRPFFVNNTQTVLTLSAPTARQVFQRSASNNATVTITGTYSGPTPATIYAQAIGFGVPFSYTAIPWFPFVVNPLGGVFSGTITLAQGGWYSIQVRAGNDPRTIVSVDRVGVGECFLVSGQSNSANYCGTNGSVSPTQQVPQYDQGTSLSTGGVFALGQDPQPSAGGTDGSPWPNFMDILGTYLGVPICVCATGQGGTTVTQWQPGGSLYPRITAACSALNTHCGGFRCVLWFQGESDAVNGTSTASYESLLRTIIAQSKTDSGNANLPWGIGLTSYDPLATSGNEANIITGQTAVGGDPNNFLGPALNSYLGPTYRSNDPDLSIAGAQLEAAGWKTALISNFGW